MNGIESSQVSEAVWPRQVSGADGDVSRARRHRRCLLQAGVAAAAAVLVLLLSAHKWPAAVILVIGGGIAASGFLAPRVYHGIDGAMHRFGHLAATGLTWLLLAPFYLVFFTVGRVMMRVCGKDPLQRAYRAESESYWDPRDSQPARTSYERQY